MATGSDDWKAAGRRYPDDDWYGDPTEEGWSEGYGEPGPAGPGSWPAELERGHEGNGWDGVPDWPTSAGQDVGGASYPRGAAGQDEPSGYGTAGGHGEGTGSGYDGYPGGPGYRYPDDQRYGERPYPGYGTRPQPGYEPGGYGAADTGSLGRDDTGSFGWSDGYDARSAGNGAASPSYGQPDGYDRYDHADGYDRYDHADGYDRRNGYDAAPAADWQAGGSSSARWADLAEDNHEVPGRTRTAEPPGYESWGDDWDDDDEDAEHEDWDDADSGGGGLLARFGRGGGGDDDGVGGGGHGRRRRTLRRRITMIAVFLAVPLLAGVAISAGYESVHNWFTNRYGDYSGSGHGKVTVVVPPGASLMSLGPALLADQVIEAVRPFDTAANAAANASALQPGTYQLHYHMNAALAVSLLLSGKTRVSNAVTIPEGLRASQIAAVLAKKTGYPVSDFMKIINHPPAALGLPSYAGGKVEGYLFPDTYSLQPKEKPLQILQTMVAEFKQKVAGLHLVAQARAVNLTPAQVITIASLVQAEGNGADFGQISRVIDNRLNQGMKLGFDSTVFYAMGKYGTSASIAQTHYNSPYNTYLHAGLPPGAIDSPGMAAIQAALHPPHGTWLYFITVNLKTGLTKFTASYTQFQQWQAQAQG
ncbi:MAG: endolytic transglycosylase MltG [Streptosporangiaceae bacterium]